jgi:acyl-homoserine-lactone acylase
MECPNALSRFYRTHHGPVVRKDENGNWITVALMNTPIPALLQSWGRTKAKNIADFERVMALQANSSNNTIYAIVTATSRTFHVNYVPVRDAKFDWTKAGGRQRPCDGIQRAAFF